MPDSPSQLRMKAEACRRLADLADDVDRKDLWLKRADDWEQLAEIANAEARPRRGRSRRFLPPIKKP